MYKELNLAIDVVKFVNDALNKEEQYGPSWKKYKNKVQKYNESIAYIYDSNFLLILVNNRIFSATEDDGNFYLYGEQEGAITHIFDCNIDSIVNLLTKLKKYLIKYGIPYHYILSSSFDLELPILSNYPCGYSLGIDRDAEFIKNWKLAKSLKNKEKR